MDNQFSPHHAILSSEYVHNWQLWCPQHSTINPPSTTARTPICYWVTWYSKFQSYQLNTTLAEPEHIINLINDMQQCKGPYFTHRMDASVCYFPNIISASYLGTFCLQQQKMAKKHFTLTPNFFFFSIFRVANNSFNKLHFFFGLSKAAGHFTRQNSRYFDPVAAGR